MDIRTIWQEATEYQTFNLELASTPDKDSFLSIKGCKLATGPKGQFVSGPSTKKKDGSYFNLTYLSREFSAAVLEKAIASQPKPRAESKKPNHDAFKARQLAPQRNDGYDDEPPF